MCVCIRLLGSGVRVLIEDYATIYHKISRYISVVYKTYLFF